MSPKAGYRRRSPAGVGQRCVGTMWGRRTAGQQADALGTVDLRVGVALSIVAV